MTGKLNNARNSAVIKFNKN